MTRKQQDILTKAFLAVLLPGLVVGCCLTARFWEWWRLLWVWPAGRWCGAILVLAAPILEIYLLMPLYYVAKARGRVARAEALMLAEDAVAARRRWKRRLGQAGGLLVACLVVLEGAFRLLGIEADPIPRLQYFSAAGAEDSGNALGVREPWEELDPSDPRLRVAFLGDSITYGESVEREQTFCRLVEGLLSPHCPGGVMTINMGEPGTNPTGQAERYETLRWSIQPNVLVHVLYPDDLEGVATRELLMKIRLMRDGEFWFGRYSHLFRYVERRIRNGMVARETIHYMRGGADAKARQEAWDGLEEGVRQVKRMVEAHQGRYVIVFHPWLFALDDYPLADEHRMLGEFARDQGLPYLNLLEAYAGRDADDLRISGENDRPNPAAHKLAADRIARFLLDEVLDECDGHGVTPRAPRRTADPIEPQP
jgi:hypothetical protein